jgi:hypothetical protein
MFGFGLGRLSAIGGRSSGCRKKNSLICANWTELTLEALNEASEISRSSIFEKIAWAFRISMAELFKGV